MKFVDGNYVDYEVSDIFGGNGGFQRVLWRPRAPEVLCSNISPQVPSLDTECRNGITERKYLKGPLWIQKTSRISCGDKVLEGFLLE